MRVLAILFLVLNLVGSLGDWAGDAPERLDPSSSITRELAEADQILQQSSSLDVGEALPKGFVPERSHVRSVHHFFKANDIPDTYSGLSAICRSMGSNYEKTAFGIVPGLPAFLIVFPHHYFT